MKKCIICGKEKEDDEHICRRCKWFDFDEDILEPDETGGANGDVSLNQARENWQKGLNVRGKPIKK